MTKAEEQRIKENANLNFHLAESEDSPNKMPLSKTEKIVPMESNAENRFSQLSAENLCNAFIDGMNEGALTLSPEKIILFCNKRFAQLLKSTAEEVIGTQLNRYVQPGDIIKLDHILKSDRLPKNTIDISCLHAIGTSPVTLRISFNYFPGANTYGKVILIAFDISGFIKTENELRQAKHTSEIHIAERTLKLTQANNDLVSSRMATLSMMEDTVEAKNNLEATNRKLVAEIIERKHSELIQQVLFSISNAALITKDIEELIAIIRSELGKLIDTKNFYIAFYNEAADTLSTPYIEDEKDEMSTWPVGKSLTGYVIKNKKKLLINQEEANELIRLGTIELVGSPSQVWLGVPLEVDGNAIGAIVVQSYDNADAYDTKDLDMLEFISQQISISIQRKKTVQENTIALAKAEESDRLKTSFLQNISHEIRTPMNAILGFSDLLNEQDLLPDMRKTYTDIICKSGNHLLTILEDIINISELEAGKEILQSGKTNINLMLRDMYEQFKIKADKKNIELKLTTTLDDEQAEIITDETKLIQIISNLLNNALKFILQGSISFGYTLKNELEFYVEDTGVGISDDKYKVIFDRFKQVEVILSRENGGRGLGLGLSISKAYVELLGGRIWLKSEPGVGTVFYFSIPYTPLLMQKK